MSALLIFEYSLRNHLSNIFSTIFHWIFLSFVYCLQLKKSAVLWSSKLSKSWQIFINLRLLENSQQHIKDWKTWKSFYNILKISPSRTKFNFINSWTFHFMRVAYFGFSWLARKKSESDIREKQNFPSEVEKWDKKVITRIETQQ